MERECLRTAGWSDLLNLGQVNEPALGMNCLLILQTALIFPPLFPIDTGISEPIGSMMNPCFNQMYSMNLLFDSMDVLPRQPMYDLRVGQSLV